MSESSDQGAFEELFNLYYTWLHSVAVSIVRKKEDAEEIVGDVFLKLWEIRDGFAGIKNLETFLYTATKNKSYDYYRRDSKMHLVEFEKDWKEKEYIISPEDAFLFEELQTKYQEAVLNLTPKCKEVYLLVREEGYSYKKAAETLNVSPKTIENHLRVAIQKIREDMLVYIASSPNVKANFLLFFLF